MRKLSFSCQTIETGRVLCEQPDICWVLGGDFNKVRYSCERKGSKFSSYGMAAFNEFIRANALIEPSLGGRKFTWLVETLSNSNKAHTPPMLDHESHISESGWFLNQNLPSVNCDSIDGMMDLQTRWTNSVNWGEEGGHWCEDSSLKQEDQKSDAVRGKLKVAIRRVKCNSINWSKGFLTGVGVNSSTIANLARTKGCEANSLSFVYLGLPTGTSSHTTAIWSPLVDCFKKKLGD
ncbi:Endonuclease/exonuclease/phosphatase [Cynara cardunculus var. scolymus]|uniref:Endonuclease/exonuclease/phosphatase n=1 Tax=Cynara cardunculus var. scolymus TaxID=59895 RepID=A0A118K6V8_CYNCS|nr:Endonuclease/exonuclease/phosphatase [Cynara cardunculus var. scolymus]